MSSLRSNNVCTFGYTHIDMACGNKNKRRSRGKKKLLSKRFMISFIYFFPSFMFISLWEWEWKSTSLPCTQFFFFFCIFDDALKLSVVIENSKWKHSSITILLLCSCDIILCVTLAYYHFANTTVASDNFKLYVISAIRKKKEKATKNKKK